MNLLKTRSILKPFSKNYELLKDYSSQDSRAENVARVILESSKIGLEFLRKDCVRIPLISKVPGKGYFSFSKRTGRQKMSRPINEALFTPNIGNYFGNFMDGSLASLPLRERERFLYTVAMAYCGTSDLLKDGDQKTPGTFFECLISHLFARAFGVNPKTQIEVLHLEEESASLPTDFIFDLGPRRPKFHVPVKTSTRERAIQVFAHQKVLEGVHGFDKYTGILVCLAETKLNHKSKEVIEICVPKQWVLYQRFISKIHRFYYFDIPKKYEALAQGDPPLSVMSFATFYDEVDDLIKGK